MICIQVPGVGDDMLGAEPAAGGAHGAHAEVSVQGDGHAQAGQQRHLPQLQRTNQRRALGSRDPLSSNQSSPRQA